MPGPLGVFARSTRSDAGKAIARSWSAFPQAAPEFHLVGNSQRCGRHEYLSGGFLGLDNIGIFDRGAPLPTGGSLEQSDGTSWMAMYTLNLLAIALELASEDPAYEDVASKFWEHFIYIANAMNHRGDDGIGLWDETDGFFYDVLKFPDGSDTHASRSWWA